MVQVESIEFVSGCKDKDQDGVLQAITQFIYRNLNPSSI